MNYTILRYHNFFKNSQETTQRTLNGIRRIRRWIRKPAKDGGGGVPQKDSEKTLLLATWNIRDFGKDRGYGKRNLETIYYIAEIISTFDLVALQEINADMSLFKSVMRVLGGSWDFIATDVTGNQERMVFVFDKRKVYFRSIVGEITLLENELIRMSQTLELPKKSKLSDKDGNPLPLPEGAILELPEGNKSLSGKQFNRTPFMVSFGAGWFKFNLCTVHLLFGSGKEGLKRRIEEISKIGKEFKERGAKERKKKRELAEKQGRELDQHDLETYLLLGDFNILAPKETTGESETLNALLDNGFGMHPNLREKPTNMFQTEFYDQIAVLERHGVVRMRDSSAGVLNFYDVVYRASEKDVAIRKMKSGEEFPAAEESDFDEYFDAMGDSEMRDTHAKKRTFVGNVKVKKGDPRTPEQQREWYATEWRTYHMSDHLPMWMALEVDFAEDYFQKIEKEL